MKPTSWTKALSTWISFAATLTALLLVGCGGTPSGEENVDETASALCSGASLTASPPGPSSAGTMVTLTVSGVTCGTTETPEYRYYYVKNGQSSVNGIIKDWSSSTSVTWNTTGLSAGAYQLIVNTRAVGTSSYTTTYTASNYQIGNVCNTVTSYTESPAAPQSAGTIVSLSATASCTGGSAEFQFYYLAPGASGYVAVGPFGPSPQSWNTTGLPSGSYTLFVAARAVGNSGGSESYKYSTYQLGSTCSNATLSASPTAPQPVGTQVTLTGGATCASPQFRYSFRLFGSSTWTTIGTWVSGTQNWDTTGLSSGTYQVLVEARANGNTGAAETTNIINYPLGNVCNSVTLAASPSSPGAPGVTVNLTGAATCTGSAVPEYRFLYRLSSTQTYTEIRTWGVSTVAWDTTGLSAGAYYVEVQARASGSTDPYQSAVDTSYSLASLALTQISASLGNHTCGRVNDGTVRCWGANDSDQLGATSPAQSSTPLTVSGLHNVTFVATGVSHSVALLGDGTVASWGLNSDGQLGNNSTTQSATPVVASGLSAVTQVSAGTAHTCALLSGGTVDCWGNSRYGQVGPGGSTTSPFSSPVPVAVSGISGASAVSAGSFHSCALVSGGVSCWGDNSLGQLGAGTTATTSATPVAISGLSGVSAVSAGDSHTCALVSGSVKCWGDNTYGQLGDGTTNVDTAVVTVPGISTATSVAAGFTFSCALLSNQTVKCWGRNAEGEIGDGTGVDRLTPTTVSSLNTVTQLSAGSLHACSILSSGGADCWGYNNSGQIGNASTSTALAPAAVVFP